MNTKSKTSPLLLVFAIIIIAMFALVLSRAGIVEESDDATVRYSAHAEGHGAEGDFARDCFKDYGTHMWFRQGNSNRYARICVFPDGWVALQILAMETGKIVMEEVSSYIPHLQDSTVQGVINWLVNECGWTRFNP